MQCWKCFAEIEGDGRRIGFRQECPKCGIDLHCCSNCRYYTLGKPNDCAVPGTDPIKDRQARNLCDEFVLKSPTGKKNNEEEEEAKRKAKKLLGLE